MLTALLPAWLVERIGWLLVHSMWQFTLAALLLAAALRALRRAPATARYATAVFGWLVMLFAPAATWLLLPGSAPSPEAAAAGAPRRTESADSIAVAPSRSASAGAERALVLPAADPIANSTQPAPQPSAAVAPIRPWWFSLESRIAPRLDELVAVWWLGVLVFGLRPAWGWYTIHRFRRRGVSPVPPSIATILERVTERLALRRPVRVFQSTLVNVPVVVGYLRPVILLPLCAVSGLSPRQVEAVLAHELAHIRRHDFLVNLLQSLLETILFYHPAVWWVSSRIRQEREHCCDELAAQALGSRVEYGRALLALEELRGTTPVLALGARGGSLVERIRRLAGAEPSPRLGAGGVAIITILVLMLAGFGLWTVTQAQESSAGRVGLNNPVAIDEHASIAGQARPVQESPQPPERDLTVRCIDSEGKPVAGAEVHLFQHNGHQPGRFVHTGPFTSDEQGHVTAMAVVRDESGHFDRWVYARVQGRLVGVARSAKWKNRDVFNPDLRVELHPSRSVEGRVTVPAGFDPERVLVRVRTMHVVNGPDDFDYDSFPRESTFADLDKALPEIFERRPDAEGRISLADVPVRGRLYLITVGDGLGEAQWRNENLTFNEPIALNIEREGSLSGQAVSPDGQPVAGVEITARLSPAQQQRQRVFYLSTFGAVTNPAGEFTIRGLPNTDFILSVKDPQERWILRPRENLLVTPDERRNINLQVEPGVRVTGRVVDAEGNPVEGAGISAIADSQAGPGLADDSTDADGRYEFRLPSGGARVYFNSLPDGFEYPEEQIVKELDIQPGQAEIENLDFTLSRSAPAGE